MTRKGRCNRQTVSFRHEDMPPTPSKTLLNAKMPIIVIRYMGSRGRSRHRAETWPVSGAVTQTGL